MRKKKVICFYFLNSTILIQLLLINVLSSNTQFCHKKKDKMYIFHKGKKLQNFKITSTNILTYLPPTYAMCVCERKDVSRTNKNSSVSLGSLFFFFAVTLNIFFFCGVARFLYHVCVSSI